MDDSRDALVELMNNGIKTIIYVGGLDFICNIDSQIAIMKSLKNWNQYDNFQNSIP